jgi:Sec-independent protein translocase protein TatA
MPDGWEWAILVVIALLLVGGSRLSGVGRNVGRSIRELTDGVAVPRKLAAPAPPVTTEPEAEAGFEPEPNIVVEPTDGAIRARSAELPTDNEPA